MYHSCRGKAHFNSPPSLIISSAPFILVDVKRGWCKRVHRIKITRACTLTGAVCPPVGFGSFLRICFNNLNQGDRLCKKPRSLCSVLPIGVSSRILPMKVFSRNLGRQSILYNRSQCFQSLLAHAIQDEVREKEVISYVMRRNLQSLPDQLL